MITSSSHRYHDGERRHRPHWADVLALAIVASVMTGVFVYVLAMRLEPIVLALIAVAGIAFIVAVIAIIALVIVILRQRNGNGKQAQAQQYTTTPPQIMVVPPMSIPHYQQPQLGPPMSTQLEDALLRRQRPRHFTVVGEGSDDEFWSGA